MGYYKADYENCIIVKRHIFYIFSSFLKFIFFIIIALFLYWFLVTYKIVLSWNSIFIGYTLFLFIFIILNYSFIRLILSLIEYYNNLIIIHNNKISIIRSSLFLKDDMEAIDPMAIKKFDAVSHGLISNILGYWNLIIEQMDHLRTFHFIPHPEDLINILREQKLMIFNKVYLDDKEKIVEKKEEVSEEKEDKQ